MKNKLQEKIYAMLKKTLHIFSELCVSLKKDNPTTEKDLCEKEKCGKFEKIKKHMKLFISKVVRCSDKKKYDSGFTKGEILEIFKNSFNETVKNREKQKNNNKKVGAL